MTVRADFEVARVDEERGIVFLVDLCNEGAMSITNDAEAVIAHCHKFFPGKRVVYRDTEGRWDELDHVEGMFVGFKAYAGPDPLDDRDGIHHPAKQRNHF